MHADGDQLAGSKIDVNINSCSTFFLLTSAFVFQTLRSWRGRSFAGQAEAQNVIKEMLTPSGGRHSNCVDFVAMVTGSSLSTVRRVAKQLQESGNGRLLMKRCFKRWTLK